MHNELRELLRDASGESTFVVAANIDIRGFSSFFSDSSQAAAFLSYAYTRILDEYFKDVSFFKPTGDGLLLLYTVSRETLRETVASAVEAAVRLDAQFASICDEDDLINYSTPPHVGIGLARGTATRLAARGKVLDFSGTPLNLCSRLMDLARPHGVVFDEGLGIGLIGDLSSAFLADDVYIKGIADTRTTAIFRTESVSIPANNRRPFGAELFAEDRETLTFAKLRKRVGSDQMFVHDLVHEPIDHASVLIEVEHPVVDHAGRTVRDIFTTERFVAQRVDQGPDKEWSAVFNYSDIVEYLEAERLKPSSRIDLLITYLVPLGTLDT